MSDAHASQLDHQFEDLDQQREAASLGMWVFLAQEVMFFGGMFAGYAVYRNLHPEAFAVGSRMLDVTIGALNTGVLIGSSLTVALAVRAAQLGQNRRVITFIVSTMALGSVFLGVKGYEYLHKWHDGLVPGLHFTYDGPLLDTVQVFLGFYFVMTGMHALHMVIGMGLMIWLIALAAKGKFTPQRHAAVENFGLYWHFVDIVWIFLFPLLYLLGRH